MLNKLKTIAKSILRRGGPGEAWSPNDQYVTQSPSPQTAIDLFAGRWSSILPLPVETSGSADLFDDNRIRWMLETLGDITHWRILELGPLEAGHTTMIEQAGAGEIVAVEANKVAYLKCLIIKELLSLRARFLLGDFDKLLAEPGERYDLIVASGVLYHMIDPLKTILNMMRLSPNLFIWSHFFDGAAMPEGDPRRTWMTGASEVRTIGEDSLTYHDRSYRKGVNLPKFCGGIYSKSIWIEREELVKLLERHGYKTQIAFDEPDHVNGPAACVLATKSDRVVLRIT